MVHLNSGEEVTLVIDDEQDLAEIVVKQLNLHHLKAQYVLGGSEGYRWLEERLATQGTPGIHCIISDWMMAQGDGVDLLKKVRSSPALKNVPFVLMSDAVSQEILSGVAQYDPDGVLLKPFDVEVLVAEVKKAVESRRAKTLKKELAKASSE